MEEREGKKKLERESRRKERLREDGSKQEKRRGKKKDGEMGGERKKIDFQKFEILTASMLCSFILHHRAKFHAGRSSRSGHIAVY